ncbi:MAG: SUMF1/EgtB/PvdO family nonheme iron enzyme [Acidobacteria bacterium]|nr:SUMF1/EgtB/PvdO family nonheme iron enzyme [Acidobacteriota bacterium]
MKPSLLVFCAAAALAQDRAYVRIPAGSFQPVGAGGRSADVAQPFLMSRTEVTYGQFQRFVSATGYITYGERPDRAPGWQNHTWRAPGFPSEPRQPVVWVTAADAEAYCRWDGGRLPTEIEWEHASRAGSAAPHHFGKSLDPRYVWYRENSQGRLPRAGTRRPNAWGLHDMEGSVWELVLLNEKTPVLRGGSWMNCPAISPWAQDKPIYRRPLTGAPNHRDNDIGFRCVREALR